MEKTVKTEAVKAAYDILNDAKLTKMDTDGKLKVVKAMRVLKPIANGFDEASKDAALKLKEDGFDERLAQAQSYEKSKEAGASDSKMTEEEYRSFVAEIVEYNKNVSSAVKDIAEKENKLCFDAISKDEFGKLIESNDWNLRQILSVEEVMTE